MHPYEEIRDWASRWSQEWFLDADGSDRFKVAGISAGWATHVDAFETLMSHATAHWLSPHERTTSGIFSRLKRAGLDRLARHTALRLIGNAARLTYPGAPGIVVEVPTPSMLEPASLVVSALHGRANVGASDPRALRRLRAEGAHPIALFLPWREQQATLREASADVARAKRALERDPPRIRFRNRDVTGEVLEALDALISRSMPWLGPERTAIAALLAETSPPAVAVASDQHRIGRIIGELARQVGTSVVVLQHGLPQTRIGLLPVVADRVATWSEESRDWFMRHGTDAGHLTITGNPRLDGLVALDRERAEHETTAALGLSGAPRLLLTLSPTAGDVNEHAAGVAIRVVEAVASAALIIKLHPGQGSWSAIRRLARESPARRRIRVVQRAPLPTLLGWATAVLLHRSTVAVEALAAGTPVAVVDAPGAQSGADLELAPLALPRFSDADEVVDWVGSGVDRDAYLRARRPATLRLAGPLDGGSAARIARLLRAPRLASP